MAKFDAVPISAEFRVLIEPSEHEYPEDLNQEVNVIWNRATAKLPLLFNGKIFCYRHHSTKSLYGQFVEYKYFYAGMIDGKLQHELNLVPIGVTAITTCGGRTLIGRRSEAVTLYRKKFEFAPAGSIDPQAVSGIEIDLQNQYFLELEEEAGIAPSYVDTVKPFLFVHDKADNFVEIFAHVHLQAGAEQYTLKKSKEYSELLWLDHQSLKQHFSRHSQEYVPIIRRLYDGYFSEILNSFR